MKTCRISLLVSSLLFASALLAEDFESGLGKLSENLAAGIGKADSKKISVIDFTDLQGHTSELGRYVAEQLSVSLVNSGKGFSVMDRANMKSILDEHKLTASGLVNPEKARELGRFSGVDAIVLGNITLFGDTISITAKAVSTETTQVLAATKIGLTRTKDLDALLAPETASTKAAGTAAPTPTEKDFTAPNGTTAFNNFSVELISFRFVGRGVLLTLKLANLGKTNPLRVGLNSNEGRVTTMLFDENGTLLPVVSITGINAPGTPWVYNFYSWTLQNMNSGPGNSEGAVQRLAGMYEIEAGQSSIVTLGFETDGKQVGSSFRLHAEMVVTEWPKNSKPLMKLNNVLLDGIQPKQENSRAKPHE